MDTIAQSLLMVRQAQEKHTLCMAPTGKKLSEPRCLVKVVEILYSPFLATNLNMELFLEQFSVCLVNYNIHLKITPYIVHSCRYTIKSYMICFKTTKPSGLYQLDKINRLGYMYKA